MCQGVECLCVSRLADEHAEQQRRLVMEEERRKLEAEEEKQRLQEQDDELQSVTCVSSSLVMGCVDDCCQR